MASSHIIIRRDHVLCTVCFDIEPIHCGSGTPMDTLIYAYQIFAQRHPRQAHEGRDGIKQKQPASWRKPGANTGRR